jgi:hypothetical protein
VTTVLGLVVTAVGVLAIGIGGWAAMNARRPPWLSERTIPTGRERLWGLAITLIGCGMTALGLFWVSDIFGALGILGVLLIFVGVGFLVFAAAPGSMRR